MSSIRCSKEIDVVGRRFVRVVEEPVVEVGRRIEHVKHVGFNSGSIIGRLIVLDVGAA